MFALNEDTRGKKRQEEYTHIAINVDLWRFRSTTLKGYRVQEYHDHKMGVCPFTREVMIVWEVAEYTLPTCMNICILLLLGDRANFA